MLQKKYFAFISYTRADEEWAIWLQHEIENYHLPSSLNARRKELCIPKELRPVFRDTDELKSGKLSQQITDALRSSSNLIVICSPKCATKQPNWVNKEIEEFIRIGQEGNNDENIGHIFPFIVDGKPYSLNKEEECFPSALKFAEDNMLLGGNVKQDGRDKAFVKVLAGMLPKVGFNDLWNRYGRDKAEQERKERERKEQLQIVQSLFLAEKVDNLIADGDSYLARVLSLKALPKNVNLPDRPFVSEAEAALRKSLKREDCHLLGHEHSVISSIYSNDDNRIFSASWDAKLCVWDAFSGGLVASHHIHKKKINSLSISLDGGICLTASQDKSVILWNTKTLKQIGNPICHHTTVNYASLSPCGKYVLSALDESVCIWDLKGNLINRFNEEGNYDVRNIFHVIMIDDSRIITSSHDGVKVWNWDRKTNIVRFCKLLNNRNQNILNGNRKVSIEIENENNRGYKVISLIYSPAKRWVIFGQKDNVYLWNTSNYRLIKKLLFSSTVTAISINNNESRMAVACSGILYMLDIPKDGESWKKPNKIIKFKHGISDISFCHRNKNILLISFSTGQIRQIDLDGDSQITETTIYADSISFISNHRFVVASDRDMYPGTICDLRAASGKTINKKESIEDLVEYGISHMECNEIIYDSKNRIIYSMDSHIVYAYLQSGNHCKSNYYPIRIISNYECCFKRISIDGKRAVYAYKDGTMCLFDVHSGKIITILEKTKYPTRIHSACFSFDSQYVATTSDEGYIRVYSAKDGSLLQKVQSSLIQSSLTFWGNSIEFNHSGDRIISASQDYYVYIWKYDKNNNTIELEHRLSGHEERVCRASFSSDDLLAVSASPSKVIVWDAKNAVPLDVIDMDPKGPYLQFVKFSPDNSRIFISRAGKLSIIDFPKLQNLIDTTKKRCRYRKLTDKELNKYYLK